MERILDFSRHDLGSCIPGLPSGEGLYWGGTQVHFGFSKAKAKDRSCQLGSAGLASWVRAATRDLGHAGRAGTEAGPGVGVGTLEFFSAGIWIPRSFRFSSQKGWNTKHKGREDGEDARGRAAELLQSPTKL